MADEARYSFRPVALCGVLTVAGLLLLLFGLKQIMRLDGAWKLLGAALTMVAGFPFVGAYLLGRCAEMIDAQGVRVRGIVGDWQEVRWTDVATVEQRYVSRSGRRGGYVTLVITGRNGAAVEVTHNERVQAVLSRYSPVPVPK